MFASLWGEDVDDPAREGPAKGMRVKAKELYRRINTLNLQNGVSREQDALFNLEEYGVFTLVEVEHDNLVTEREWLAFCDSVHRAKETSDGDTYVLSLSALRCTVVTDDCHCRWLSTLLFTIQKAVIEEETLAFTETPEEAERRKGPAPHMRELVGHLFERIAMFDQSHPHIDHQTLLIVNRGDHRHKLSV